MDKQDKEGLIKVKEFYWKVFDETCNQKGRFILITLLLNMLNQISYKKEMIYYHNSTSYTAIYDTFYYKKQVINASTTSLSGLTSHNGRI